MLWKREPTLSILGDAIASFLSQPDEYTKNLGITSRMDIVRSNKDWSGGKGVCLKWQSRPNRWLAAATNRRWMFTVIASILLIVAGLVLLAIALYNQSDKNRSISLKSLLAEGFGTPNSDTIIQVVLLLSHASLTFL
ncbi:hypothetical protein MMC07_000819 [Pseudocyphellaria aurata]|nr:hypothetical protein [Pseudocyphellaria aurata]